MKLFKKIYSLLTLIVLVLTECFIPISYAFAENDDAEDSQVQENIIQENNEVPDTISEREDSGESTEENTETKSFDDTQERDDEGEYENNISVESSGEVEDIQDSAEIENLEQDQDEKIIDDTLETNKKENIDDSTLDENDHVNNKEAAPESSSEQISHDVEENTENTPSNNSEWQGTTENISNNTPEGQEFVENSSENKDDSSSNNQNDEFKDGEDKGVLDEISEEIQEIMEKIRYFFKRDGSSKYIIYGKDANNIGTITLKDSESNASITIMDKNLGAESTGIGETSYGYYFQWGNNSGVMTVNSPNKTTQKAVYSDNYESHGYDGQGVFIVGSTDYWENGEHYNNLWGNESKESARYGACPAGYHIPTIKEWNQLLDVWGRIHTQDNSADSRRIRYSANYPKKDIHTFKGAATQCVEGDIDCVEEDKLSSIVEVLSSELKLPLAGEYDENGNFHEGVGIYWTSVSKDNNTAGVFDIQAYFGEGGNNALMYKAQGHNIRCFQNIYAYETPKEIETQDSKEGEQENQEIQKETEEIQDDKNQQNPSMQNSVPTKFISYSFVLETTKDLINLKLNANGGKFENDEIFKTVNYGYYVKKAVIDVEALKQDEYRSGYKLEEIPVVPVGYKPIEDIEVPTREGYIFDGWYTQIEGGEKLDISELAILENLEVYAHWIGKEYTITWKNEDGTVRDVTKVAYGEIPIHKDPIQPSDEEYTYTFAGWEPEIKVVDGDAEYRATYTYAARKYTITWKNEDGTVRDVTKVAYGEIPIHKDPIQPSDEEYTYTFAGWEPEIKVVDGDAEYRATYTYAARKYTITWKNEDGTVRDVTKVAYGEIPIHKDPIQPSDEEYTYTFAGWEPEIKVVDGDAEYRATYTYAARKYTITWENEDGTVIDTTEVTFGDIPTHEDASQSADEHYSYTFTGWEPEVKAVDGDTEYRAKYAYTVNKYTVTWKDEDGKTWEIDNDIEYGSIPTYDGEIPTKQPDGVYSYVFAGWNPEISDVKGNIEYVAKFDFREIENKNIEEGGAAVIVPEKETGSDRLSIPEYKDDENVTSLTEGKESEGSSVGGKSLNTQDYSLSVLEGEDETEKSEEIEEIEEQDPGFFKGLWETLKSFFLEDEDGYLRGSETIKDIIVSVEAEEGTFPEGTEVVIKGVSEDRLESIQTSLIEDENNNVPENIQIVAFDISFVYSGEEIQPEKEVSVKFNYKENSDFQGASERELSIYHIDDETDEGEEVEVVNKEGDEIEILATSFSTYALVLTTNPSITLHLDAAGGDLSNNTGVTITDTPNPGDGEIITDQDGYVSLPTNVRKIGYTFVGWYEDAQYTTPVLLNGSGKYQVNGNTPTLYAKRINGGGAYGVTYVFADDVTFDGTNYINTDLKLFSSSFGKKDFDINFNVDSITAFNPGQNQGRNNIMHIINETASPGYLGFDLRLENNANSYKGQIRAISQKDSFTLSNSTSTPSSFRFWTENNVLHYYNNGNDITSQNFSSTSSFNYPLVFGAASNTINPPAFYRYMKGVLSDITVYVAYDNGDEITLPNPTRPDKIFVGWYTDNQFTHPVTLVNGKYVVGANEILYAKWADYEITIEPNISEFGSVDKTVVFVSDGSTIVSGGNTLTIIDIVGQEIIITATESGISSFTDRDISDCGSPITKTCTIVANFISDKYIVKFDPNGGTFDMFGNDYELEDGGFYIQVATSGDKLDELNGEPILPGYIFTGWYNGANKWNFDEDVVEDNITLKAKWDSLFDYGDLNVYIVDGNGASNHYTLMDRNMGAENIYNGDYDHQNFSSFGYIYQWGNNYGFNRTEGNGNTYSPEPPTSNIQVSPDVWMVHSPSNYITGTWFTVNPWNSGAGSSDDLWGSQTNGDVAKQGPCPDGYHVPTRAELVDGLYTKWSNVYGYNIFKSEQQKFFTKDVLMPLAGTYKDGSLVEMRQGVCAEYWLSALEKSSANERAGNIWFCRDDAGSSVSYKGTLDKKNTSLRYNGLAVRCFKNGNISSYNLTLNRDGGTNALVSVRTENGVSTINSIKEPIKSGREFGGWYTTNDFQPNSRKNENSILPAGGTTLYAKWICPIGQVEDNGTCVPGVTVSFYDEGANPQNDNPLEQVTVLEGQIAIYPNVNPTKEGYIFDGWIDENGDPADLINVTEDIDVFASFSNGCSTGYHIENGECVINTYIVTWTYRNLSGEWVTNTGNYVWGSTLNFLIPTYPKSLETKYIFTGWEPALAIVTENTGYTAIYTEEPRQYTITFASSGENYGTVSQSSVMEGYGTPILINNDTIIISGTTVTATATGADAQYTYAFSGWNNTCGETITGDCTITAEFKRTLNEYTVTWKNYDNSVIKADTGVVYGTVPEYSGSTPERPAEGIYAYVFTGWTPSISEVTGDQEYTAVYTRTSIKYKVTWRNIDGTTLEIDEEVGRGNMPQYNSENPTNGVSNQYVTSTFAGWNPTLSEVVKDVEYMARYTYTLTSGYVLDNTKDSINVTLNANGGEFSNSSGYAILNYDYYNRAEKEYVHSSNYSDNGIRNTHVSSSDAGQYPTTITGAEYLYVNLTYDLQEILLGWANSNKDKLDVYAGTSTSDTLIAHLEGNTNDGIQGNADYTITGDSVLIDFYLANRNISTYESNGFYAVVVGVIPVGYFTNDEIQPPSREGYTFAGWYTEAQSGSEVDFENLSVSGNMQVYAHWTPNTNTQYIVHHYVKRVGEATYAPARTDILSGTTDQVLTLSLLAKENEFMCAHYSSGSLTGNEVGPGEIVTGSIIKGDGSTEIYLYYTRYSYAVRLSGDEHIDHFEINGEIVSEAVRECGSNVPIEAIPKPGYHFSRWEERSEREDENEDPLGL